MDYATRPNKKVDIVNNKTSLFIEILPLIFLREKFSNENLALKRSLKSWLSREYYIKLSEECLSFIDTSFTTMNLYRNMKPNLSNIVIFILIK